MHIVLTICSAVILCLCFFVAWVCTRRADETARACELAEEIAARLRSERDRVTVSERELDALRRELRKLSGKFYASQREQVDEEPDENLDEQVPDDWHAVCENYQRAQTDGPGSKAAACECSYCLAARVLRARARALLVPKGVRATADVAKLNAGQP